MDGSSLDSLWITIPSAIVAVCVLFLASTIAFDLVHYLLHGLMRSRHGWMRALGEPHAVHHRFLDRTLTLQPAHLRANLYCHVVPEFLTQLAFSGALLLFLPAGIVLPVIGLQAVVFVLILRARGMDVNHRSIEQLSAYRPLYFCVPEYHALHHVFPEAHFSSWIKTLDHVVARGTELRERRIGIIGETSTAQALQALLEGHGCDVEAVAAHEPGSGLGGLDILVLGHAAPTPASPDDDSAWVERYCEEAGRRQVPLEVWTLGSELSSAAPAPDRHRARLARRYLYDARLIYRYVALPEIDGAAESELQRAARRALLGIRRGLNYVPTTRGPRAWQAFLRFRLGLIPHS